ncbi:Ig-like domain-containing protein [Sulfurovum mangrovi]|uniref:Ig-like domain-containing protein n=1 Tax=Sulfurovum mangrovi TaxID=2893889 RepID=UPI001E2C40A7|nr:Ig-like domain-containing protein [Sulfurovum mangrovi]UFH58902.1 Ig-like domain-containing protein [Sulfurovum mangrovi]
MGRAITIIVKEGQNVISSNSVAEGSGRPLVIKAKSGQSYELKDMTKGVAPDEIYVMRDGKNLKIKIGKREKRSNDTDDTADIIIEEYFDHDSSLIGAAENGEYYNYIPQGANPEASYYSLGGETIVESETDWLPIILGALAVGAIAAAAGGGGGGGGGEEDTTPPDHLTISVYNDDKEPDEIIIDTETSSTVNSTASIPATNDNTPTIKGNTEAGADVTITFKNSAGQDILTGTVQADYNGNYQFVPDTELPDGQYYVTAVAKDAAGNALPESTGVFEIDTVAPDAPILDLTDGSDISGTAEPGTLITITDGNGNPIGTTTTGQDGYFSYTPDEPIPDATVIEATATDAAGNESTPGTTTVDASIADAPIIYDDVAPVIGEIHNNDTTNDTQPEISGEAGSVPENVLVEIYDNGIKIGETTSNPDGSWSFTPTSEFANGSDHSITYTKNGGTNHSPAVNFTVDTTAPDAVSVVVTDDVLPIIGEIADNGITDDTTPTISGTTEPGASVTIKDGDTELGTVTADSNGDYEFTPTIPLNEGEHTITVTATDAAGNSVNSDTTNFTVDTTAPDSVSMVITDDVAPVIGEITENAITDDTTPTISGKTEPDATVMIKDGIVVLGTVTADANGDYEFTPTIPLDEGSHAISVTASDAAGNSVESGTIHFTIDTDAPDSVAVAITGIDEDTATAGDFITSDNTLVFSGTNGALGDGEKVQISLDGGVTWTDVDQNGTQWSYDNTSNTMVDGTYTVEARVIDAAGNVGNTDSQSVVVDTTPPDSVAVAITGIDEDTATAGDFITSDNTLVFSGTNGALGDGEKVQISLDGGVTWTDATQSDATHWSYDNRANTMADGTYTVEARVIDAAGNVGNTDSQSVVVDTTPPDSVAVAITGIDEDTATAGDFITSDNTLVFSGTNGALGDGEKVQISLDGGVTWTDATQSDATHWSYDNRANTMSDGTYTVEARVIDAAGNVGNTDSQSVVVDTTPPDSVAVAITGIDEDTATAGDFITSDNTLVFSGTNGALGDGEKVQISLDGGVTWTDATQSDATHWSYDNTANTMADGTYTVEARVIDAAGNVGNTDSQSVVVDTTPPDSVAVAITGIDEDTATAGDFITSDNTLVFSGTNDPLGDGEKVQISLDGGNTWIDTTKTDATHWSYDNTANTMPDGTYTVEARVVDAAGNVGNTDSQSVVVDTEAPDSVTVAITGINEDTATAGDFITSDNTLVFSGTNTALGDGEKVQISLDGGNTWTDTTKTDATHWSYDNTANTMPDGTYTVEARVIDAAGNTGSPVSQDVVVDTTAPTSDVSITAIADDTGAAGDFITADNTLVFSGTNTALGDGEKVQVSLDGGATWMDATQSDATHWSYDNTANTMADGTYTVEARVVDAAGNVGTNTDSKSLEVDTEAPTATITMDDTELTIGETTTVTITFSEPVVGFASGDDVLIENGTLSEMTSSDGGKTWTGTFTPTANITDTTNVITLDDTYTDEAGNTGTTASANYSVDTTPPPVIILDDGSKLINPVYVDGKYYYYWDKDGDGLGIENGNPDGDDMFTHDELDAIFMYDVDGNQGDDYNGDTTDIYRYATLLGETGEEYNVALPTFGAETYGLQAATEIDNNPEGEINPTYDDLVAIWDAFEGGTNLTPENGTPPEWANGEYWSSTQFDETKHYSVDMTSSLVGTNGEHETNYVAVEVIF